MEISEFVELLEIGLPRELDVSLNGIQVEIRYGNKGIKLDPTPILDNVDESQIETVIKITKAVFQKVGAF